MSEDDRAAKAARAKAMLKKRQQKKAGAVATTPSAVSPLTSPPASRAFSPSPSEPVEDEKRDLGDVFAKDDSDTAWLSSLPRVGSPPRAAPVTPSSVSVKSPRLLAARPGVVSPSTYEKELLQHPVASRAPEDANLRAELVRLQGLESKVQQTEVLLEAARSRSKELDDQVKQLRVANESSGQSQQQTISLLVSEKATLTAELERLEGVESKAQQMEALLEEERNKSKDLDDTVQQLQSDAQEATKLIQQAQYTEKDLTEKCREQERQLQLTNATIGDLRKEAAQHQGKLRELQEQIQSDDRVERLENSLKNTQDRADELEFQLSKLKQAHAALKSERDDDQAQLRVHIDSEAEWKSKHSGLHAQHLAVQGQLASTITEKDIMSRAKSTLEAQLDSSQKAVSELREKLAQVVSELAINARQLQTTQNELRNANRRADDAEKTQKDLQAEGTNLMRSLDEMRPKIVELTAVKVELGETIDGLEHALRTRDSTITQLESTLEEIQELRDEENRKRQEILGLREKEISSAQYTTTELQKAYAELQTELETSLASIRTFEAERSSHHQDTAHRLEEIDLLTVQTRAQMEELSALRRELDERRYDQEEEQDFLERAQNEIESLRIEVSSKDQEIERLREAVSSPTNNAPRSLDAEMLSSLRQQHALDLSAAQSQIRALETSVFEAQAKSHSWQKQVSVLEDELLQLRSGPRATQRPFSPGIPSRSSSRAHDHSDLRRASLTSHRPSNLAPPISRSFFEHNLNPETRHKRKVSLSMLKARIDSELATPHPPSRALSPVPSRSTVREPVSQPTPPHLSHRPQFLDESHVFWCHSCRGDLVIL